MRTRSLPYIPLGLKSQFVALTLLLQPSAVTSIAQGTMQISFEGQPPGTFGPVSSYVEQGLVFWNPYGPENLSRVGSGVPTRPDNGTAYLQVTEGAKLGFRFQSAPFTTFFGLVSFDIAERDTAWPGPATLQIVGYGGQGYVVTNTITTDGVNDGTGPLQDFQTFTFGPQFSHIYRIDILSDRFSIDNLILSGVPEPTSATLLGLGAAAILFRRFHAPPRIPRRRC